MNTAKRTAFINAYLNNVGNAPREYVEGFLDKLDANLDIEYDEYYSSVADALGMWYSALEFSNNQNGK